MSHRPHRARSALLSLVLALLVLAGVAGCDARAGGLPSVGSITGLADGPTEGRSLRGLDGDLRDAVVRAGADAAGEGVTLVVNSGWRSSRHQRRLFDEAVARYGSADEAARWVARPGTSVHESGDAVDIGTAGAAWLGVRGAAYGLCRVYDNEPWHFELRPDAVTAGCPATYADPTHDPRMH